MPYDSVVLRVADNVGFHAFARLERNGCQAHESAIELPAIPVCLKGPGSQLVVLTFHEGNIESNDQGDRVRICREVIKTRNVSDTVVLLLCIKKIGPDLAATVEVAYEAAICQYLDSKLVDRVVFFPFEGDLSGV